jgi:hypothetical protein
MKRLICTIIVVTGFSISAQAKYSGGSGTGGDPYQIANVTDLLAMGADANDYGSNFVLTADINLGTSGPFTTAVIAPDTDNTNGTFDGNAFTGIFDGNDHKISNLTIDTGGAGNDYLGLFGKIGSGGQIKNLGLINVSITDGNNSSNIGGLVGGNEGGTVSNCHATGTVAGGSNSICLGGLVGYSSNGGLIIQCYATGTITGGNNSEILGGLVGDNSSGTVSNCYSTGAVTGGNSSYFLGGLVGYNYNSTISNSYSTGAVTGGNNSVILGGLVGSNHATVSNCYSTGTVAGGSSSIQLGGLVGWNTFPVSSSYFLAGSGPDDGNGTPLTDTEMKQQASFVGWDFVNIWTINEDVNYPKLAWQTGTTVISGIIDVTKCTVAAGSKGDSISFSGTMNATADDFNDANSSSDANFVEVTISDENSNDMDPCVITFPVNGKTWKKGKFSYSGTVNGVKKSFSYVVKTGKFTFAASNINLSGLECTMTININVGDFAGTAEVNETIVNGKTPIPINLLMGVKNSLRVDKSKFTKKSGNVTHIAVSGEFSDKDANDANLLTSLDINVGSTTFTIPAGNFKNTKGKFTCSNVSITGGVASATFDFNKCTFTLTIKNTSFPADSGTADFKLEFGDFSESDDVVLP